MKENNFQNKVTNATKWSSITEVATKLVSPITNMVLARIIVPNAFGIVATITMIISFADMFTDAGFQKYLVQKTFKSEDEKFMNANVAFWTNLGISVFLWLIIIIYREKLAISVGNPGLGNVVAVASVQLLLTSFSSIQMALYRRDFDFKTLFMVRMISVFIPFVVTLPLAFLGLSYWALIIGTITMQLSNAIILTVKSKWKPKFFFSVKILREMFSYSIWSLVEAISIWLSVWIDTFIIGNSLNTYYLGLYKTSTSMVSALIAVITSSAIPVLFSTLSRLQEDKVQFSRVFLLFQRIISVLVFPLGIGIYLYSDFVTQIILGSQWSEASGVIGIWALTRSIKIVLGDLSSEVYRAKGRPKLSFLAQLSHLAVLIPACIISVQYGFWSLVYVRSLIQLQFVLVHFVIMKYVVGFPILKMIRNVLPTAISAILMGCLGYFLKQISDSQVWGFISIIICILFYFGVLSFFPNIREEILGVVRSLVPKRFIPHYKTRCSEE